MVDLRGSLVAIVTPFKDGDVDLDAFTGLCEWQVASGTNGLVVCGTTGEAATLHLEEKEALTKRALAVARGRVPVVVGTGTNATWSTVLNGRAAAGWGADALLVVTPYYNKPTQAGLLAHFTEAARVGCPVVLYDVPGRTGVTMAEETVARLAEVETIVALKDATQDGERAARLAAGTRLTLLSGDDACTLSMMRGGAAGVISVAANVVPAAMATLCADRDESVHETLAPLFKALFVQSSPIPVKFALARMGKIRNELRLPMTPLDPEHEEAVIAALNAAGAL